MVNLGTYRVMIHDEKTTGLYIEPTHHGRLHCEGYHKRGESCPVAVSIGHHPLIFRVASLMLPEGVEYQYIGAIQGEPVEVIEEEVTGLPVPADSEIVIAGWCPPGKLRMEGPFGEFTGYYGGEKRPRPVIEVERIYYRDNPIILGSPPGKAPNDYSYFASLFVSVLLEMELERSGITDVKGVWVHEFGAQFLVAVSIKQRYAGHARRVGLSLASGRGVGRYVIVVDEDIDVTDLSNVLWALCTRTDPEKDIEIVHRLLGSPLDPIVRKPADVFFTSRAILDACKPYEWIEEFPEVVDISPELVARVKDKWGKKLDF